MIAELPAGFELDSEEPAAQETQASASATPVPDGFVIDKEEASQALPEGFELEPEDVSLESKFKSPDYILTPQEFKAYRDIQDAKTFSEKANDLIGGVIEGANGLAKTAVNAVDSVVQHPIDTLQNAPATIDQGVRKGALNAYALGRDVLRTVIDEGNASGAIHGGIPVELSDEDAYARYVADKGFAQQQANPDMPITYGKLGTGALGLGSDSTAEVAEPIAPQSNIVAIAADPTSYIPLGIGAKGGQIVRGAARTAVEKTAAGTEALAGLAERARSGVSDRITGAIESATGVNPAGQASTSAVLAPLAYSAGLGPVASAITGVPAASALAGVVLRRTRDAAGVVKQIAIESKSPLGSSRLEDAAASGIASNTAIPERYRAQIVNPTGNVPESTLRRVANNPNLGPVVRKVAALADRPGARLTFNSLADALGGATEAGGVSAAIAALSGRDPEEIGQAIGAGSVLGGIGGLAKAPLGSSKQRILDQDADIARLLIDTHRSGGNVDALAQRPHDELAKLAGIQGLFQTSTDFIPLTAADYHDNLKALNQTGDIGAGTAGVFVDQAAGQRPRIFLNLDDPNAVQNFGHEYGHALLKSPALDGAPRLAARDWMNQLYGESGVKLRGTEYAQKLAAAELGKTPKPEEVQAKFDQLESEGLARGEMPLDWARDEIFADTFRKAGDGIDINAIRRGLPRGGFLPNFTESILGGYARALEGLGIKVDPQTGAVAGDLFTDNPLTNDWKVRKRIKEYTQAHRSWLEGTARSEPEPKGTPVAPSGSLKEVARSTGVKLRETAPGVRENNFFREINGKLEDKPQKEIDQAERAREIQVKNLGASKILPANSPEFGPKTIDGKRVVTGKTLPPAFDFYQSFPQWQRNAARHLEAGATTGDTFTALYHAIGTGRSGTYKVKNRGNLRAIQREIAFFNWSATDKGNILAHVLDITSLRAKALKALNEGKLGLFDNDLAQFQKDILQYFENHKNNVPGEYGIGVDKKNAIQDIILGKFGKNNPTSGDLGKAGAIRTFRLDRLEDLNPTGRKGWTFDYDKTKFNRIPSMQNPAE
jgi:hypothetical protein